MRRRTFLGLILTGLLLWTVGSVSFAVEELILTTPETFPATTSITSWKIDGLTLMRSEAKVIIHLVGSTGEKRTYNFSGALATTYINALNTRNASTISNEKWTLNQLVTRGYLAGTVRGTPD